MTETNLYIESKHKYVACKGINNYCPFDCSIIDTTLNNLCPNCFYCQFPNDMRISNYNLKTKEIEIVNYVCNTHKNIGKWYYDKQMENENDFSQSKRRIDLRILIENTILCIEVDENQHKSYKNETLRYIDILRTNGHNYIFIRYNPDTYKTNNVLLNPDKKIRFSKLSNEIIKQLDRIKNKQNTKSLELIYLFYDEYDYTIDKTTDVHKINIKKNYKPKIPKINNRESNIKNNKREKHIYKCLKCSKQFKTKWDYNRHINKKISCDEHDVVQSRIINSTNTPIDVDVVINNKSDEIINVNNDVNKINKQTFIDNTVTDSKHSNKINICEYCDKIFSRSDALFRHKEKICKEKKNFC